MPPPLCPELRQRLVLRVVVRGEMVISVARDLWISKSTAYAVVHHFLRTGSIDPAARSHGPTTSFTEGEEDLDVLWAVVNDNNHLHVGGFKTYLKVCWF